MTSADRTLGPKGATVMVGARDVTTSRPVTLGDLQGESWMILSGLATGDRVIVDGLQKVQQGKPVRVVMDSARSDSFAPIVVRDTGSGASP